MTSLTPKEGSSCIFLTFWCQAFNINILIFTNIRLSWFNNILAQCLKIFVKIFLLKSLRYLFPKRNETFCYILHCQVFFFQSQCARVPCPVSCRTPLKFLFDARRRRRLDRSRLVTCFAKRTIFDNHDGSCCVSEINSCRRGCTRL